MIPGGGPGGDTILIFTNTHLLSQLVVKYLTDNDLNSYKPFWRMGMFLSGW